MKVKAIFLLMNLLKLVHSEEIFGDIKQGFFACDKIRNVTIFPFMQSEWYVQSMFPQLTYLVKSLLDTPCTTVWIYSPLEYRSIPQKRNNFDNFLETKIQAIHIPVDTNVVIDFITEVKNLVDEENEQTILLINDWAIGLNEQHRVLISDSLKVMESME